MPLRPCSTCSQPCPDGVCPKPGHKRNRGGYRPHRPSVMSAAYKRIWRRVRDQVLLASNRTCAYDRQPADTGDHVIPLSKGGETSFENVLAACARCNTSKGDRTLREWVESGLAPPEAAKLLAARIIDGLPV